MSNTDFLNTMFDDMEDESFTNPSTEKYGRSLDSVVKTSGELTFFKTPDNVNASGDKFWEDCPACRGTGNFYSYTGRFVGKCFKCKGKGKLGFKVEKSVREAANARAKERKAEKLENDRREYAAANPEVVEWMVESVGFAFAESLKMAFDKYGTLTDRQTEAAKRCIAKRNEKREAAKECVEKAPEVTVTKVAEALANAFGKGIKRPKLRLGSYIFSRAPDNGRNAGAIYVKEGDEYLGKIMGGKFLCVGSCGAERRDEVVKVAEDPEMSAVAYGKMTGNCSCCGKELTVKESVERGIGPICWAKFFGA